jgi:hypothetical protein
VERKTSLCAVPASTDGLSGKELRPMLLAASLCAILTLPVAWNARAFISSDGVSYLEMALNTIRYGPRCLLTNGSWSPGYPVLLAVALKLAHPSPVSELIVVHSLDWAICASMYFCFTYFFVNLLRWIHLARGPVLGKRSRFLGTLAFAYTLLFISNLDVTLWLVGPNIMLEGSVYLVAGVCIRLSLPDARFIHQAALGVLLALAYITKAVMFPLSFVLLAIFLVRPACRHLGRKGTAVAAVAFLLAASPLVAGLSYSRGRMTFSDIGNLNFAWYVNEVPRYWDLQLPDSVTLLHTPKTISINPAIVKFDGPIDSTYSYWYDPSYWYDGVKAHLDVRQVLRQFLRFLGIVPTTRPYSTNLLHLSRRWIPLYAGLVAFVVLGLRFGNLYQVIRPQFWLILWPAVAVFTFACVHAEYRYLVPFVVLAWTTLFAAALVLTGGDRSTAINLAVAVWLILTYCPAFAKQLVRNQTRPAAWQNPAIEAKLQALGIRPGDELASMGFADYAYDARLVGARFTIQIPNGNHSVPPRDDPAAFSKLPETEVRRTLAILKANGAKALFSAWRPAFDNDSGWVPIGERDYVRMLQ